MLGSFIWVWNENWLLFFCFHFDTLVSNFEEVFQIAAAFFDFNWLNGVPVSKMLLHCKIYKFHTVKEIIRKDPNRLEKN